MPLTDVVCRNAKPAEKPKKLTDAMGLYLVVMPNGSKLWRHKYRHLGKEKLASYGSYPGMQLLAWLGFAKLGLALHDRTIPRPPKVLQ